MAQTLVHLVYVHGFQGNDTTFQTFPTDLQKHLAELMPKHLKVQSSLYPTYKSKKPISYATRNFLDWLSTQHAGPVIVIGHSMGGLLVAEAATDSSSTSRRIIGMIAFDTPYLGMHPHVVISGIASLFPKDEDKHKKPSEHDMNHDHVNMVDQGVTDDWHNYKKNMDKPEGYKSSASLAYRSPSPQPPSFVSDSPQPSSSRSLDPTELVDRTLQHPLVSNSLKFLSAHTDDPFVRWARKHSDAPFAAGKVWVVEHFQFGSCMFDPSGLKERYQTLVKWNGPWVNYWTETIARKKDTGALIAEGEGGAKEEAMVEDNDAALIETGMAELSTQPSPSTDGTPVESLKSPISPSETESPTTSTVQEPESPTLGPPTKSADKAATKAAQKAEKEAAKAAQKAEKTRTKEAKAAEKAIKKRREAELKAEKKGIISARHFIVLPTGLGRALGGGENWERVQIEGVQDEVAAHCGLFIRGQNLDYDGLVERVGKKVLGWCETIPRT